MGYKNIKDQIPPASLREAGRAKIKYIFVIFYLIFAMPAYAATPPCDPKDPNFAPCPAGLEKIESIFSNFISVFAGFAFVALLVLAITAGFKYLTSGGEPKAVSAAHQTLTWSLLGIFLMAVAWIVLQLIFTITGVDITIFDVKKLCGDPNNVNDITKWFCKP